MHIHIPIAAQEHLIFPDRTEPLESFSLCRTLPEQTVIVENFN